MVPHCLEEKGAPLLLRKSRYTDIDRIMDIIEDGRGTLASLGVDQWQEGYPLRTSIEQDISWGESYVLENEEADVVATAMISFREDHDYERIDHGSWISALSCVEPRYAVIHRVAVREEYRGFGIASFILREAEKIALQNACQSVRIDTHADNRPMRNLLKKEGYTHCGTIFIAHAQATSDERCAYEKLVSYRCDLTQ